MSFSIAEVNHDPRYTTRGGIHVAAGDGVTKWFDGGVVTVKLMAASTHGTLGVTEASIPPGSGPGAHAHADQDETFYLISGELEMLDGNAPFIAGPGDLVFVPRGIRHGFRNVGLHPAKILILFTPGGPEGVFVEGGDDPQPGVQVPPWGPEHINEHFVELMRKYGAEALP